MIASQCWTRICDTQPILGCERQVEEAFGDRVHALDQVLGDTMVLDIEEANLLADFTDLLGDAFGVATVDQSRDVNNRDFAECCLLAGETDVGGAAAHVNSPSRCVRLGRMGFRCGRRFC